MTKNNDSRIPASDHEPLDDALARLGVGGDWTHLLVGDGSGSTRDRPCGWGCVLVARDTGKRDVFAGVMNRGTNNAAEVLAYLQALEWLVAEERDRRKLGGRARLLTAAILTDSEYARGVGSGPGVATAPRKNVGLWAAFAAFARVGVVLRWHHVGREDLALNAYADRLSKMARTHAAGYNFRKEMRARDGRSVYDYNP